MRLLCENRSGKLKDMQGEMESIMSRVDSRDIDTTSSDAEVTELVDCAKQATLWRVTDPSASQIQDTLARREIRVMRSYRPKLLRAGTAASQIRIEVLDVLVKTGPGADAEEGEVFWDGCDAMRR
jgi:hypothetical protein